MAAQQIRTTVLLTGGCGFIGSNVCANLLKRPDHRVVIVDNLSNQYSVEKDVLRRQYEAADVPNADDKNFIFYEADFTDHASMIAIFERERPTVVCHLGAKAGVRASIENPFLYIQTNISGTVLLMELARQFGVKNFVYASSSSVYGKTDSTVFSEDDKTITPVSPYAATKATSELMAHVYNNTYGLKTTGLRFFTVYGPRGRPDMAPYKFVDRIYRGVPIDKYGDGNSSRDYTFVTDIAQGVCAAIDTPQEHAVYNLGNCNTVTLNEFIALIERLVGKKAIIRQLGMQAGDVERTCADMTHSTRDLGYSPQTSIEEGMRQLVQWYIAQAEGEDASSGADDVDVVALEEGACRHAKAGKAGAGKAWDSGVSDLDETSSSCDSE